MNNEELKQHARNIRKNIVKEIANAQSGHPGGSLGAADIVTYLYFEEMDITPENAGTIDRDRFVLSKGHTSPLLYAALAEKGIIPMEELMTFRKLDSKLQGHPNMNYVKGVDMSTGSLGQGLAAADGMAIANKLSGNSHRVYALVGDGESEEGEIWEAAMAAHHYNVIGPNPLTDKFRAFGWHVVEVNGHDFDELRAAFKIARETKGVPMAIIAHTIKGKGVLYMENQAGWHGKAPNAEQLAQALKDLEAE